jgi:mannosyltransferase OCH1-like enzyme
MSVDIAEERCFFLRSYWGTFVHFDPETGRLRHAHIRDCPLNLAFFADADMRLGALRIEDRERKLAEGFAGLAAEPRGGLLAVRQGAAYLSAAPPDLVTAERSQIGPGETFEVVPYETAHEWRREERGGIARASVPGFIGSRLIPRTVHQTFPTARPPRHLLENVNAMRRDNPGFTFRLWTQKDCMDFIYESYGYDILRQFLRIHPAYGPARADLFRYLLMYKLGGVYLDIKSAVRGPIERVVESAGEYLLSQWDNAPDGRYPGSGLHAELSDVPGGEFEQWHIVCRPAHPFLEQVILRVLRNIAAYDPAETGVGKFGVLKLTGPIPYTLAIAPMRELHPHRLAKSHELGLEYSAVPHHRLAYATHYTDATQPIVL